MTDTFVTLADLLRQEVKTPVYARLYEQARQRHAALEPFPDLPSMLAFLRGKSTPDVIEARDAITLALLQERAAAHPKQWATVLSVVFLPMLLHLRHQIACTELSKDDIDQLVLESFLVAIGSYRPTWQRHTPIRITHLTRKRVFILLRRELDQRRASDGYRNGMFRCKDRVPAGCAPSPPLQLAPATAIETAVERVGGKGAFVLRETELRSDTLYAIVDRFKPQGELERKRLYERLKRVRFYAKRRLLEVIAGTRRWDGPRRVGRAAKR